VQRLVVHPPDHQDRTGVELLRDRCDETLLVTLQLRRDGRVECGRSGHGTPFCRRAPQLA